MIAGKLLSVFVTILQCLFAIKVTPAKINIYVFLFQNNIVCDTISIQISTFHFYIYGVEI